MSHRRIAQIWFGILGIAAGVAVLVSGTLTAGRLDASEQGIAISVVEVAQA